VGCENVEPVTDLRAATWLIEEVTGFAGRVRDLVPATYDAFARVVSAKNLLPVALLRDVLARQAARHGVAELSFEQRQQESDWTFA
jgi:hypothetical protein